MLKMTMKGLERRGTKRLAVGIKVNVYRIDKDTSHTLDAYLLETRDMTQKGLFLRTPKTFPIDTKLRLEVELPPDAPEVSAEGKVAWIAKKSQTSYYPGMGIEITRIKRGEGKMLKDFLREKFRNYRHALELKRMYMRLKEMAARLYELEQSHAHAEHFRKIIDSAIKQIDHIAHLLDKEVWEVKSL